MDRVLLTGISGFLGGHVALALLDAGYTVRGSVRDPARADQVRGTLQRATASGSLARLEIVTLDLLSDTGWAEAAHGCRYLQHVASPFVAVMPKDRNELIRPAVDGTRRALRAALAAGVERIVLTSSTAAVMYGHPRSRNDAFTDADWSRTEGADVTAYTESKTLAELEAWSIMEAAGRRDDLAVINPAGILGPLLDTDPGTSGQMLLRLLDGSTPALPRLEFGIVDVRDVAELHLKAMTAPAAGGHRLLAAADTVTIRDMALMLRAALPDRAHDIPTRELPDWLMRLAARFLPEASAAIGSLGYHRAIDAHPAETLLGHPFRPPAEAVAAMGLSLVAHKLV